MSNEVKKQETLPFWKRLLFSELFLSKTQTTRIAYVGLMTALCIVANTFLEIKFLDNQYSFTIVISILAGILIGPLAGFCAAFLGDTLGYIYNSWGYVYMPWVGLSVACMALIAGLVMNGLHFRFKGSVYVKLALICVLTFLLCSVAINSTGMYYYNKTLGFSAAVTEYAEARFGKGVSFLVYCLYRFIFKGQIFNSLVNYALLFVIVPTLGAIKPLKIKLS